MVSKQQHILIETYTLHQIIAVTSECLFEYGFGFFVLDFYV